MNENIKRYFEQNKEVCFQRLDDNTAQDLNIDELFCFIDRTKSVIGQQCLYNLLRSIPEENTVAKNEVYISSVGKDEVKKKKTEKLLSTLSNADAYYICSLFQLDHPVIPKSKLNIYRVLQLIPFTCLLLFIAFNSKAALLLLFLSFIANLVIHYKNKQISFLYAGSVPQLLKMLNVGEKLSSITSLNHLDIKARLQSSKPLKKHFSLFRFEAKLDNEMAAIAWLASEIIRIFFLLEPVALFRAFSAVNDKKEDIKAIFMYIGHVDILHSIAEFRSEFDDYCIPQYSPDTVLRAEDIHHPLIENCVKNSFSLEAQSFLVMGSNMSGKTSFMRTIALNTLTAQTVNICFASHFVLQRQKVWTAITLGDDILEGVSYYLSEVLRIRSIVEGASAGNNLIIIDELFKGTNTEERIAISQAILTYLSQNRRNIIMISTHDTQLSELINTDLFNIIHFKEKIENGNLSFPYLIQEGKPTSRNAIKILELYNYPDDIVKEALGKINK